MSTLPLEDHSYYEQGELARFEATPAAPESFDPIAALRRVEALAAEFDSATFPPLLNDFDRGLVAGYARGADRIRAALAGDPS